MSARNLPSEDPDATLPDLAGEPDPEPFEPGPASLPGCGKPAIVGCLVVIVFLGIGLLVLISQSPRLLRAVMTQMRTQITRALPAELDAADRERLDRAFDGAIEALMEGRFDSTSLDHLQKVAAAVPRPDETLTVEEVREITLWLEDIGHVPPRPSAARSTPSPWLAGVAVRPPPGTQASLSGP